MSSLRRKACRACAKSKRRCDGAFPACSRCESQSIQCQYPFATMPLTASSSAVDASSLTEDPSPLGSQWPISPTSQQCPQPKALAGGEQSIADVVALQETEAAQIPRFETPPGSILPCCDDLSSGQSPQSTFGDISIVCPQFSMHNPTSVSIDYDLPYNGDASESHGSVPDTQSNHAPSQVSFIELLAPPIPPQFRRTKNWTLYANTLVSNVTSFALTTTTFFISHRASEPVPPPNILAGDHLSKAFGVCSAYTNLQASNEKHFEQMLKSEVSALTMQPQPLDQQSIAELSGLVYSFREGLCRLQAMTLYQIIGLFSPNPSQRYEAEKQESLVLSWTRELQFNIQALESHLRVRTTPSEQSGLERGEIENAYRTILMSYIVRAVYAAVAYRVAYHCDVLKQLPVVVPPLQGGDDGLLQRQTPFSLGDKGSQSQQIHTISYHDFAEEGMQRRWDPDTSDPFHVLLLAICKGSQA